MEEVLSSQRKEGSSPPTPHQRRPGPSVIAGNGGSRRSSANPIVSFGPQTESTESTESVRTVRGDDAGSTPGVIATPSGYPFPRMTNLATGTPVETPGAHKPFTALSPTVTPNLAKMAKNRISQDFRASGYIRPRPEGSDGPAHGNMGVFDPLNPRRPNVYEIAINIQSELGLVGWWTQVTQALRDNYGAERVTLAVATDATDVENVPWAQLGSYYAEDEDDMSRITNEPQSSKGSLHDTISHQSTFNERLTEKDNSRNLRNVAFASSGSQPLGARPKLESRHSYAGYPTKQRQKSSDNLVSWIESSPSPSRVGSFQSSRADLQTGAKLELNADVLHRHDVEELAKTSFSDDFSAPLRVTSGRILQPVQPLESEADSLLTTAGVVRVLRRELATVLTREYRDRSPETFEQRSAPHSATKSTFKSKGAIHAHPTPSPKHTESRKTSTEPKTTGSNHPSRRRSSGSSKHPSSAVRSEIKHKRHMVVSSNIYEDFEQYPGTPWAQSPAPSPAPQADPSENPFFSSQPDQGAFEEPPSDYEYGEPAQIPAIGLDRSQTIIQLPIIHPSATVSQLQRHRSSRTENKPRKGLNRDRKNDSEHAARQSSPHSQRRVPIAILSILAPTVPYPAELVDSLNELSPLLATSFYAARSHTHMLLELTALSHRRPNAGNRFNLYDEQSLSSIAVATGLTFVDSGKERPFSPVSPSSTTTSASTQSTANLHSPKGSHGGGSAAATPGWESNDSSLRPGSRAASGRSPAARSPGAESSEMRDDYFQLPLRQQPMKEPSSPHALHRPIAPARTTSISKKQVLHSQGASFANTQPSLPSATSSYAMDDRAEVSLPQEISHVFKEPSSSILRTMIDNGATQQFIAESETGNLVWANSKFLAYRNASKENIHEQLWKNIYYKDVTRFRTEWNKSLETGEQLSYQVRLKRFDNHHRWFHIRFLPLKDKYGLTKYWHGQAMDIHELHEAEVKAAKSKEKAASEAKYRAIANSLPVIVFAASVPTGMTFANTQWLSYSGQTMEEALGFGFLEHVHPEDLVKCRFPGIDVPADLMHGRLRPRMNPLVRSESSVSSTGESEGTGVTEGTLKPDLEEMDGAPGIYIPNELLRGLAEDGIIMCAKDELGNLSITTEMRLKNRKGEYRWHLVQGSYIESVNFGQGEAQWFIACTDISNQKLNEAKIQDANSALETANMTLENEMRRRMGYLSSMSHEIRTPLNGIIGNLQFLINSGLNETNSEWAHSAQESAKNMHELINDILDLSKAEANMLQLSYAWFSPREIMEQVMDMLSSKASEKKIEFVCECLEGLPKVIRGDPGRIRQVLLNLAGNAIKFTTYGEVVVVCELLPRLPKGSDLPELGANEILVKWTVTDTGSGFSDDEKKLLFKPYSQIKNRSTRDAGGTGLGLILCQTMVTLHGGLIDASSKPGRGSVFSFFARFKARKGSTASIRSGTASPVLASPGISHQSPAIERQPSDAIFRKFALSSEAARESPAVLSDSSSAQSIASTAYRSSVRSSVSTVDSGMPLALKLPSNEAAVPAFDGSGKRASIGSDRPKVPRGVVTDTTHSKLATQVKPPTAAAPVVTTTSPLGTQHAGYAALDPRLDSERSKFRPPLLSVLVICPAEQTRRISCDQIKYVAPRSAPCNITSEVRVDAAEKWMHGDDPVTFTHVVFRVASDELLAKAVKHILDSPMHTQTCIVIISDQAQVKSLAKSFPGMDFEKMSDKDRIKFVLKPAHVFKLAKIFDPFNENFQNTIDPKEAKRNEEKRLQKESYALFKKVFSGRKMRVLAVEDNSVQMNILCNFLQKICHLDVEQAWNGQECLDLYTTHDPHYYSVIVTDIEMPVLDGLTMCRRLRDWEEEHHWPPANVVSLSANTFHEGWTQSSEAGFTHYCPKPVNFRDLGLVILELTDPDVPHKFLKDRTMPKVMLKKLGLLPRGEGNSDDSDDDSD